MVFERPLLSPFPEYTVSALPLWRHAQGDDLDACYVRSAHAFEDERLLAKMYPDMSLKNTIIGMLYFAMSRPP